MWYFLIELIHQVHGLSSLFYSGLFSGNSQPDFCTVWISAEQVEKMISFSLLFCCFKSVSLASEQGNLKLTLDYFPHCLNECHDSLVN